MCVCIQTYTCTCRHCLYLLIYSFIHSLICLFVCLVIHTYIHTYKHTDIAKDLGFHSGFIYTTMRESQPNEPQDTPKTGRSLNNFHTILIHSNKRNHKTLLALKTALIRSEMLLQSPSSVWCLMSYCVCRVRTTRRC